MKTIAIVIGVSRFKKEIAAEIDQTPHPCIIISRNPCKKNLFLQRLEYLRIWHVDALNQEDTCQCTPKIILSNLKECF